MKNLDMKKIRPFGILVSNNICDGKYYKQQFSIDMLPDQKDLSCQTLFEPTKYLIVCLGDTSKCLFLSC